MQLLGDLLNNPAGVVATIGLVVWCLNTMLTALGAVLEKIQDKTATQLDNKALVVVNKICSALKWVIDVIGHNPEH